MYVYLYRCAYLRDGNRGEKKDRDEYFAVNGESTTRESLERHWRGDEEASRRPYSEPAPSRRVPFVPHEFLFLLSLVSMDTSNTRVRIANFVSHRLSSPHPKIHLRISDSLIFISLNRLTAFHAYTREIRNYHLLPRPNIFLLFYRIFS